MTLEKKSDETGIQVEQIQAGQKALSKSLEPFQRMQKELVKSLEPFQKMQQELAKSLQEMMHPWIEFQTRWVSENAERFRLIEEHLKQVKLTIKEADQILTEYKWIITPSLPIQFVTQVTIVYHNDKLEKREKRKEINRLFIEFFTENNCKNLSLMVESWKGNPLFKKRMKIIRNCVWAMKNSSKQFNASNLVIPTLTSQIDGLISDYLIQNGWVYNLSLNKKGRVIGNWVDKSGKDQKKFGSNNVKCLAHIAGDQTIFLDSSNFLIMEIFFQKAYNSKKLENPFTFSRHKIVHGEYTTYGRKDNVIRTFLILDFLANLE